MMNLCVANISRLVSRSVPELSLVRYASHFRVREQQANGVKMRISVSKEKQKQFLEPSIDALTSKTPIAADDPRRFFPVSPANSSVSTMITHDELMERFIGTLMRKGEKELTRKVVEKAFVRMKHSQLRKLRMKSPEEQEKADLATIDPLKILHQAINNCRPILRLEGIRRGGIMYQVPVPVTENFSYFQAMRWIIESCRERESKADTRFDEVLAEELLAAGIDNTGKSVRKKQDLHRRCEQNRAYAHFRW